MLQKFQQGGTLPAQNQEVDYFAGMMTGQIQGNHADVANKWGDTKFTMQSADKYWNSEGIQQIYGGNYDKFKTDYNSAVSQMQAYDGDKFEKFRTNQRTAMRGMDFLVNTLPVREHYFTQKADYGTSTGAKQMFGQWTEMEHDARKYAVESNTWFDYEGKAHKLGETLDMDGNEVDSINDIIRDDAHVNDKGRQIIKFVYDPNTINDPYYRGAHGMHAVYDGEYDKFAGAETVSGWDAMGYSSWDRDASWYDFLPRTVAGIFSGIIGGVGALGAGAMSLIGADSAKEWFEMHMLSFGEGLAWRQAENSKAAGFGGSWDSTAGTVGDVVAQLLTGRAVANVVGKASLLFGGRAVVTPTLSAAWKGRMVAGTLTAADATAMKWGSTVAMTLYGGKDMYKEALANGFSAREAGFAYFTNLAALGASNHLFNWMDDYMTASKVIKGNSEYIRSNTAYTVDMLRQAEKIAEPELKELTKNQIVRNFYEGAVDKTAKVIKGIKKGNSSLSKMTKGYTGAMVEESFQEMTEFVGEEMAKEAMNFYSFLANGERVEQGEGRFKDMWDKGYWEEFRAGLFESAIGGAIGGAVGRTFFKSPAQDDDAKKRMIDIIAAGDGEALLQQIDKMHAEGVLGPKDYSTEYDEEAKAFKKMDQAGENAMSMNDANKQLLLQEYAYLTGIINKFGAKEAFNKMIETNGELDRVKDLSTSISQDLRGKVQEYVQLVSQNELEEADIKPHTDEMSEEEVDEHYAKQARENGTTDDVAKRMGELQKDIEDIKSGKATEKYFIQALSLGSVFDPNSEKNKDYKEYGKGFLSDLMDASNESAKAMQDRAEVAKETMKENDKVVNGLSDDLSNLEEVERLFDENGQAVLSDKAKEKIQKAAQDYKIPDAELNDLKEQLNAKITKENGLDVNSLAESPAVKAIAKTKAKQKIVAEGLAAFSQKAMSLRMDEVKDSQSLFQLRADFSSDIIEALQNTADEHLSDNDGNLKKLLTQLLIGDVSKKEAQSLGEQIAEVVHNDPSFEAYADLRNVGDTNAKEIIQPVLAKYMRLAKLAVMTNNLAPESEYEYNAEDVRFLMQNFHQTPDGKITDEGNLFMDAHTILNQYEAERIEGENSPSTFNDIESIYKVLKAVKARRTQLELLNGLQSFEPQDTGHIAVLRARMERARLNPQEKSKLVIGEALSSEEKDKHTKFFNQTGINVTELYRLHQKGEDMLTPEEKDTYDTHAKIFSQIQTMLDGNEETGFVGLNELETKLVKILDEAEKNQNQDNIIAAQKGLMIAKLHDDRRIVKRLLIVADLATADSELGKTIESFGEWVDTSVIDRDDASIKAAFARISEMKNLLYQLDNSRKDTILNTYLDAFPEPSAKKRDALIKTIATTLYFNENDFWTAYKEILAEGKLQGVPLVSQEEVALSVAAHMNSEIAEVSQAIVDKNINSHKANNVAIFVSGLQGSGKSTFTLGVGLRAGLAALNKRYDKSKLNVLIASNSREQVNILEATAKDFGLGTRLKTIGGNIGVTSTKDSEGVNRPLQLIELLENAAFKNSKDLNDVATIVFDEATFIEHHNDTDSSSYAQKSDLAKIIFLINEINSKRGSNQPQMKLILMGDPYQNGRVNENGEDINVGHFRNSFYTTTPLKHNMRSQIASRADFLRKLLASSTYVRPSIDGLKGEWGRIAGSTKLGGIAINDGNTDFFNDEVVLNNIQEQIDIAQNSSGDIKFTVGVILPEGETVDNIPEDSRLRKMIEVHGDRFFTVTTHEEVQGREFDYAIVKVSPEDIGDEFDIKRATLEKIQARKLATSIGRARFFTAVINTSQRNISSEFKEAGVIMPDPKFTGVVIDGIRQTKIGMIEGTSNVKFDEVVTLETATNEAAEETKSEQAKIDEQIAEEQAAIVEENKAVNAKMKQEEALRDLVSPKINAAADKIADINQRVDFLDTEATKVAADDAWAAEQKANAEAELEVSNDPIIRTAARVYLEHGTEFNAYAIDIVRQAVAANALDPETQKIYDEELLRVEANEFDADANGNNVSLDEQEDIEIAEEKQDALEVIIENTEITATLPELNERADLLIEKANRGEDVTEELKQIKDQLIRLEATTKVNDLSHKPEIALAFSRALSDEEFAEINRNTALEAAAIMKRMEEELGMIAGYTFNGARQNKSSQEWDRSYLSYLYGSNVSTPASDADYTALQLAAIGLSSDVRVGDFDYEFKIYRSAGFTKAAIVATQRSTGRKVIAGAINQYNELLKSDGPGKAVADGINDLLINDNFSMDTTMNGYPVRVLKQGIKIPNPYQALRLDLVSPGSIIRATENTTLEQFEEKFSDNRVNLSTKIFISTDINSPYKGEAFLLYSFNDKHTFDTDSVNDLIANGLIPIHPASDIVKGFEGSIGLIRLDNAPISLVELNQMIGDTYSDEAMKLTDTVNRAKGQERLVTALGQIYYEILKEDDSVKSMSETVQMFLDEQAKNNNLQFTGKVLARHLAVWKQEKPQAFEAMEYLLAGIFRDGRLGSPRLGEDKMPLTATTKNGTRIQAKNKSNVISILLAGLHADTGVTDNTVEIALHKFMRAVRDTVDSNKLSTSAEEVLTLIQDILSSSESFRKGLYMHPGIIRGQGKTNTVFGELDEIPGIKKAFNIKVAGFETPSLRLPISNILDILNKAEQVVEVASVTPKPAVDNELPKEIKEAQAGITQLYTDVETMTEKDLSKAQTKFNSLIGIISHEMAYIGDYNTTNLLGKYLGKQQRQFGVAVAARKKALKEKGNDSLEGNAEEMTRLAGLVANDSDTINMQIANIQEKIAKGEIPGRPESSKLNEREWLYTQTPTFKSWAGDWNNPNIDPTTLNIILDADTKEPKIFYKTKNTNVKTLQVREVADAEYSEPVFVRGENILLLGDSNEVSIVNDLRTANIQAIQEAKPDLVIFNNALAENETPGIIINVTAVDNIKVINPAPLEVQAKTGESEYLAAYRRVVVNTIAAFQKVQPFVFHESDLANFGTAIDAAIDMVSKETAKILDEGSSDLDVITQLDNNFKHQVEQLKKVTIAQPDVIRQRIEENLNKNISSNELPNLDSFSDSDSLGSMLVRYHIAKNKNDNYQNIILANIKKRYMPKVVTPQDQAKTLAELPVATLEEFKSRLEQLKNLEITPAEFDAATKQIITNFSNIRELSTMVAEGGNINEILNKINDSDIRTILQDSLQEDFSPEAEKIINSTLGELKKFLPLETAAAITTDETVEPARIDNLAAAENVQQDLQSTLTKVKAKKDFLLTFMLNDNKKAMIETLYSKLEAEAISNVEAQTKVHAEALATVGNSLEASMDNLTPASDTVVLTPQAVTVIQNLDDATKNIWIQSINGVRVDQMTLIKDLFGPLHAAADAESMKNIQAYYRERVTMKNKICKF